MSKKDRVKETETETASPVNALVRQHYTDEQKVAGCAMLKFVRYTTSMLDAKRKKEAYEKLMSNDFDLPEEDEVWKVIDEPPAFYEGIRGKKLLSELGLQDTLKSDHQKAV